MTSIFLWLGATKASEDALVANIQKKIGDMSLTRMAIDKASDMAINYGLKRLPWYQIAAPAVKYVALPAVKYLVKKWANPEVQAMVENSLGYKPTVSNFIEYANNLWISNTYPTTSEVAIESEGSEGEKIQVYTPHELNRQEHDLLNLITG